MQHRDFMKICKTIGRYCVFIGCFDIILVVVHNSSNSGSCKTRISGAV